LFTEEILILLLPTLLTKMCHFSGGLRSLFLATFSKYPAEMVLHPLRILYKYFLLLKTRECQTVELDSAGVDINSPKNYDTPFNDYFTAFIFWHFIF